MSPGCRSAREHGLIHLAARIGLHIGELAVEQTARALDGKLLGNIDKLAAAIIAAARIALGIFVGEHRSLRFKHGAGDDVFGCNQLDLVALAAEFLLDNAGDIRIAVSKRRTEKGIGERCRKSG